MSMFSDAMITGYLERNPQPMEGHTIEITHVVSFWYIPGGMDYSNAKITYAFYEKKEDAERFVRLWDAPPEMPVLMTVAEYDDMQRRIEAAKNTGDDYRDGYTAASRASYRHHHTRDTARSADYQQGWNDLFDEVEAYRSMDEREYHGEI